ncbi:ACP S-malonyltransferase [Brevibacillus sp. 7WMA2]|uniref:ACP S-malonyltransferase n=1 Tax=Brevibacillus sp. 7WMA2 TaxID=2683193 RepID=UPI0013A76A6B|nr:ACP S-malonyltransferase [Brevibacillus sp. 7WMA2]QIC04382.1 ACP S-malonyltransferase [Brevibacillus sp. 7WMA2]
MDRKPIIFMFSGQGSQYYQMGRHLYENEAIFRKWMQNLDVIVHDLVGISIVQKLYHENKHIREPFIRLLYSHPAIFMVEYALAQIFIANGVEPDYVLGTSLGEYTAACISEVVTIEDSITCLIKQAKLIEERCPSGGMTAIMDEASLFEQKPILYNQSELAALNFKKHFVISGSSDSLQQIESYLENQNILFQRIPVSFGFHSRCIDPIKDEFTTFLKKIDVRMPKIPIVSCVDAQIHNFLPRDYLWSVVRQPILFQEAIQTIESVTSGNYFDLGPSGTLAHFFKKNTASGSTSKSIPILSAFQPSNNRLENVLQEYKSSKIDTQKRRVDSRMIAYLFPGQGSQKKGMGEGLFDEFREITSKASGILGYCIKELCLSDPNQQLNQTQYTQPALYTVNALSYLKAISDSGRKPDFVAGHSLGEYNALFAAGVIDFETGLQLVKKRGELMSQATNGGMAAILGLTQEVIQKILIANDLSSIDIANLNGLKQIIISGPVSDIAKAQGIFESSGATMYIPLNVSGAFHSRYMLEAKQRFSEYIGNFNFQSFGIPVISNVTARPYRLTEIKTNIIEQIVQPVRWTESIQYLMGMGVSDFLEIGHGTVLSKLVEKIKREVEPLKVDIYQERQEWSEMNPMAVGMEVESNDEPVNPWLSQVQEIERPPAVVTLNSSKSRAQSSTNSVALECSFSNQITAESLGDSEFKEDYSLQYAYLAGGMYHGISSKELVVCMAKSGMMGFFGTGGLDLQQTEDSIRYIQCHIAHGQAYGVNLVHNLRNAERENKMIDLLLRMQVRNVEASAFLSVTPSLVRFHAKGLKRDSNGNVVTLHKIIAKVSRPEVAETFLSPAPEHILQELLKKNQITPEEAELSREVPVADDICVEADSAGHTDGGVAYTLIPSMSRLRNEMMEKYKYHKRVRIGAAGGIGTPEAAMAAFMLGADFILTGSINQCTVEAGTSDRVKDLLLQMNVQDTDYAPAGDSFEMGSKVQVLKKGLFFPSRANKLNELYRRYKSLDEIDEQTLKQIQEKYFKRSIAEVYQEIKAYYPAQEIEKAEHNPKHKMALVFRWYFGYGTRLALSGSEESRVDYQIHCGPALGAFNQWMKGTELDNWRNRHVDKIGIKIMKATADLLNDKIHSFLLNQTILGVGKYE